MNEQPRHVAVPGGATRDDSPVGTTEPPGDWQPMPAASLPTRSGSIGVVGPALAVLLVAAGAVLVRDALVSGGAVRGRPWIPAALDAVDGLRPGPLFLVGGIVAALLGLWLVYVALRRRVRSRAAVASRTGIYLGLGDVARLASGAAEEVGGVISASTSANRRTVTTTIRSTGGPDVADAVRQAVAERLSPLDPAPRINVAVRGGGNRS
ncbi:DUF6286 domain-containing protein [Georgenia sp. AZ-5]|uniref:DUF6286 domain-containing protein n=1 Tax=Georgenia sp. AZ-5 TaxID=3367526 RepID=UPI003754A96A